MPRRNQYFDTTQVDLTAIETATETQSEGMGFTRSGGLGSRPLQANYESIIRDLGIPYPVAYRFLRELGRGRQGVVFLGLRQGARGCVTRHAIKLFDPSIYPSAKKYWTDMGRIANQVSALHNVHSPNLVGRDIYEESNGIGYLQMDAVDGIDLRCFLDGDHLHRAKQRSTPEEWARFTDTIFRVQDGYIAIQPGVALHILRQMLRGLEVLHKHGFVHSDVKPGNIMIDRLGYVKLVDFGRAVRANEPMSLLLGSPLYMSPETHRRQPSLVQSDLFSVGLVGLEILRGEPFMDPRGLKEADLLDMKLNLSGRLLQILPEHVRQNEELVDLLRRFVEPNPEDRFASAEIAESGNEGLRLVHKQLTQLGKDSQYERELEKYLSKLVDDRTGMIEHDYVSV